MSRLILVRHGETVWHAENRYAGRTDVAMTEKGAAQAKHLAEWARTAKLTAIWSSSLSRARLTAQPAADAAGLPLQIEDGLLEIDFGRGEGLTGAEMMVAFPEERAAFVRDPVTNYLPDGEDPALAAARGAEALCKIAEASGDAGRSLVVGHTTLLRLVLCRFLGIPLKRYRTVLPHLANGALTEIEINGAEVALRSLNVPLTTAKG